MFLRFTLDQTYRNSLFMYILLAIHQSLRHWYLLFHITCGLVRAQFMFYRFPVLLVYRFH